MRALLPLFALLTACAEPPTGPTGDPDADADADTLTDRRERELGTDPLDPDSDADGYRDGDEVFEGHDPLDPEDRIYRGGWPYFRDKDSLDNGRWNVAVGQRFPRFVGEDRFGEPVDLYDWAGPDQPHELLIIDVFVMWCGSCGVSLGAWLSGDPSMAYYDALYPSVRPAIESGEIAWVNLLTQNMTGEPPTADDLDAWHEDYPNRRIATLEDREQVMDELVTAQTGGWPSVVIVQPQTMRVLFVGFLTDGLEWLSQAPKPTGHRQTL